MKEKKTSTVLIKMKASRFGCVRETRQLVVDGESISNQGEHRGDCDADLRASVGRGNPENRPRHDYNENKRKDHFPNVVLDVARSGEFKDVTRIHQAWRERVCRRLCFPFLHCPIRKSD
jgi:hypothetical protein